MTARYSIMPARAFDDPNLTHLDLRVLGVIGYHLNRGNDAWPSQRTLGEKVGVTRESINRCLRRLREYGYIKVRRQSREDGGNHVSIVHVLLDTPGDPEITAGDECDVEDHGGCDAGASHAKELPIRTPSVAKATAHSEELFPDSKPTPEPKTKAPEDPYKQFVFSAGLPLLKGQGMAEGRARAFLGGLLRDNETVDVANAITACQKAAPIDARSWLVQAMKRRTPKPAGLSGVGDDPEALATRLDWRFEQFAAGQRWPTHWGPAPDDPAADYPEDLYRRHGLKRWSREDA
ncbi:MAG: hypothetical protein GC155_06155 [Alphaproteobacteria bacterium]|nr:hypothetical protein [Alphaproteobacteria bacterium]